VSRLLRHRRGTAGPEKTVRDEEMRRANDSLGRRHSCTRASSAAKDSVVKS